MKKDFFNCEVNSYEESLAYAKKMIVVAISNIAYLRALWPEQFFVDRYFENLQLKIIESRAHKQAHVLTKWILGVFHALERKYVSIFFDFVLFLFFYLIFFVNLFYFIFFLSYVNLRFLSFWIKIILRYFKVIFY